MRTRALATGLLVAASLLTPASAAAAPAKDCITVKTRQAVKVRTEPRPRARAVGHLKRGAVRRSCVMTWRDEVRQCGRTGKWWYLVKASNGENGYIPKSCTYRP